MDELSLALYEILKGGGFTTGGFNFDTKLRRQSMSRTDLFHGHIGGIDTLARSLLVAERLIDDGHLAASVADRYAGWDTGIGAEIMGGASLAAIADRVASDGIDPDPVSGRQEALENVVNQAIWTTG